MHHNGYQVAQSNDMTLLPRKWNYVGTFWSPSHLSAAYAFRATVGVLGDMVREHIIGGNLVIEFPDGVYVRVSV